MDLQVSDIKVPKGRGAYRYLPIDLDGSVGFSGYAQRPAAERNILRTGQGIYDSREEVILFQPDEDVRFERLQTTRTFQAKELRETDEKIAELRRAVRQQVERD